MITKIWATNFRSIEESSIDLSPITVLVGQNGSGKSNIVDILRFFHDSFKLGLDAAVTRRQGMGNIRRWSKKGRPYDVLVGIEAVGGAMTATYEITLGSTSLGEYNIKREKLNITPTISEIEGDFNYEIANGRWVVELKKSNPPISGKSLILPLLADIYPYNMFYEHIVAQSFYNIHPQSLVEPQKPSNPFPLEEHGDNLASTLREMEKTRTPNWEDLTDALSRVLPDCLGFMVKQVGAYLVIHVKHKMNDDEIALFDLSRESDGTLRILGLLTALYQDKAHALTALEEPELTIHPGALIPIWEEIQARAQQTQFLITTHSPDLLDLCEADQIRVVEKIDGITEVSGLEKGQLKTIKDKLFSPGELLRHQGLIREKA